jgi:hypothetical protein
VPAHARLCVRAALRQGPHACRSGLPAEIPVGAGHVARSILLAKKPLATFSSV